MSWVKKAPVNEILLFCETWKTREDIREQFGLSNVESWHATRYISKLSGTLKDARVGRTGRAYRYKTRHHTLLEIKKKRERERKEAEKNAQKDTQGDNS